MSYLGLCPGEHTSGADRRQGGITKLGNGIARKAMIEAAWNAQTRLHQRYRHLTGVGRKKAPVAAAALGRELAGFVWAIGRMVQPHPVKPESPNGKAA